MTFKIETFGFSEKTAERETFIDTEYLGTNVLIEGTRGRAYMNVKDGQWFYSPENFDPEFEWFRVEGKHLSLNLENGWIRCEYNGLNKLAGKTGRAYFDETENVWMYRPKGAKDSFRVGEKSLTFFRDEDLTNEAEVVE